MCLAMMLVPAMRCWLGWWPRCARNWLSRRLRWHGRLSSWRRPGSGSLSLRRGYGRRRGTRPGRRPARGLDKPPPRPRSLRKRSGRKPGGQDGHQGTTLAQVARPDQELRHEPGCCGRCGAGLAGRPVTGVERRQVFDLPEVAITVTEHQLIERECRCGHRTKAAAPQGAEGPVQYGPRIAAIIVYLYAGQLLSKERTAQALAELFGVPLSSGTVAGITSRAAAGLGEFLQHAQARSWPARWPGSTRPGSGWTAGCTGCTTPAPVSTPCSWCTPSAADRGMVLGRPGRRRTHRAAGPGA
jgi:transposase